jgi:hypothetical protein
MPILVRHFYLIYFVIFLIKQFVDRYEFLIDYYYQYYLQKYDEWHLMHDIELLMILDHLLLNEELDHHINLIEHKRIRQQL